ncbi:hypothetical protein GY45DRAFT_1341313 [Cubamyces sp. BRFM 1775]|nr:hypothetical protein GY45DRAFT_1341313 [Cubamyces sp. BRFM 1775]
MDAMVVYAPTRTALAAWKRDTHQWLSRVFQNPDLTRRLKYEPVGTKGFLEDVIYFVGRAWTLATRTGCVMNEDVSSESEGKLHETGGRSKNEAQRPKRVHILLSRDKAGVALRPLAAFDAVWSKGAIEHALRTGPRAFSCSQKGKRDTSWTRAKSTRTAFEQDRGGQLEDAGWTSSENKSQSLVQTA